MRCTQLNHSLIIKLWLNHHSLYQRTRKQIVYLKLNHSQSFVFFVLKKKNKLKFFIKQEEQILGFSKIALQFNLYLKITFNSKGTFYFSTIFFSHSHCLYLINLTFWITLAQQIILDYSLKAFFHDFKWYNVYIRRYECKL